MSWTDTTPDWMRARGEKRLTFVGRPGTTPLWLELQNGRWELRCWWLSEALHFAAADVAGGGVEAAKVEGLRLLRLRLDLVHAEVTAAIVQAGQP